MPVPGPVAVKVPNGAFETGGTSTFGKSAAVPVNTIFRPFVPVRVAPLQPVKAPEQLLKVPEVLYVTSTAKTGVMEKAASRIGKLRD